MKVTTAAALASRMSQIIGPPCERNVVSMARVIGGGGEDVQLSTFNFQLSGLHSGTLFGRQFGVGIVTLLLAGLDIARGAAGEEQGQQREAENSFHGTRMLSDASTTYHAGQTS